MSENKAIKINEKIIIPKIKLWFIWLLLFVIPTFIIIISFNYYVREYKYFYETDLLSSTFERIKRYNSSLAPESFMESQLPKIKELNSNQSFEILKEQIDYNLCSQTLLCIFFDKTGNKIKSLKNNNANVIKNFPENFIKRHIKNFIQRPKNDNSYENSKQLGIAFQQLFKTITTITISEEKIARNFSVLYGGELYFIFCKFNKPSSNNAGFIAIIRGQDFSFHKMLEKLHISFPEIKIVFKDIDLNKTTLNPELFNFGVKHTPKGTFIITPTNPKFIRHVLHGGSEKLILKYNNLFPFIEYKIPLEEYNITINKYLKRIKTVGLIIILFSFLFFLHISLFNLKENVSFKKKILYLTFFSSIFPFITFTVSIFSIYSYNSFMEKFSVKQYAETELQLFSLELEQYLSDIEYKISRYTSNLSSILCDKKTTANDLMKWLTKLGNEIPITSASIYLDKVPDNLKSISKDNKITKKYPERTSFGTIDEEKDAVSTIIPKLVLKYINSQIESLEDRAPKNKLNIAGNILSINDELNNFLTNKGNMQEYSKSQFPIWYIRNHMYDNSKNHLFGLFTTRFEPKPLISRFIEYSTLAKRTQNNYKEIKDNYLINYAFLPIENSGSASIWEGSGYINTEDKNTILKAPYSGTLNFHNRIIIKKRNQLVPYIAIATITEQEQNNNIIFFFIVILGIIIYLSLILYFANKLLDIMFVEPITLLANTANAIALGSENWDTKINSGDEFEDLNNKFKQLVVGLKERNILKSYVSEDAFSDIENNENLLQPGGEYINATIVFSAIKDFDKTSLSTSPQESIKILSKFMSIAEEVTKKYQGSIDKIIGDTIMLVFRQNSNSSSHALRGALASLELVEKAKSIGLPKLYTGIASGKVISGKIGSYSGKLDFTVIGNPVNSAARFKAESKKGTEQTGIIISGTTIGLTKGKAKVKFLRRVAIKGKSRKYNIYELVGIRD